MQNGLTSVIITHNEASNIERCLNGLTWVDRVLMVDDHSTDETREIARRFPNVTVIERDWQGYGPQRNSAIDMVSSGWILVVDADEEVVPALRDEIIAYISAPDAPGACRIPRRMNFGGTFLRFGGTYPDYQIRLFKKNAARYDDSPVHERLQVQGAVGLLRTPLNHYSYRDISDYFERFNRYSDLDARRRFARGERFSLLRIPMIPVNIVWRLIVRGGIFDGYYGVLWAMFCAWYDFVKFAKVRELEINGRGG